MKHAYCDICRKNVKYKVEERLIKEFKGFDVNVIQNVGVCKVCSNSLYIPELEIQNFKVLYEKYRKMADILSPETIIEFRDKYSISQRELTAILNWGKMTINRYERGAIPAVSHNDNLKLIIANESIFKEKVVEAYENKRISDRTYDKILKDIKETDLNPYQHIIIESLTHHEDEFNGFRKFDVERLTNLIGYLSDQVKLFKTGLNKYLWYIDFQNFKESTRSITGLRYMKDKFGPVIEDSRYNDILNHFNDKFIKDEYEDGDSIKTSIISKKNYDLSIFKETELKVINSVIKTFKSMNSKELSELSHQEDAWVFSDDKQLISYEYAQSIKVDFN